MGPVRPGRCPGVIPLPGSLGAREIHRERMMTDSRGYATPGAFRKAADTRLRMLAYRTGRPVTQVRREFLHQRLLARVFQHPDSPWALKGGVSLTLLRPGARDTRDVNLVHLVACPSIAEAELREAGSVDLGDHLRFVVTRVMPQMEPALRKVKMAVHVGTALWDHFDVGISCEREFVDDFRLIRPEPVIRLGGVAEPPRFRLYPAAEQVADKVAAIYERHGTEGVVSSRYRDLVDLVFLVGMERLDATRLVAALRARERWSRDRLVLPSFCRPPGAIWYRGYPMEARRSALDADLHHLDNALAYVGACLNPILDGSVTSGTWDPVRRLWAVEDTAVEHVERRVMRGIVTPATWALTGW